MATVQHVHFSAMVFLVVACLTMNWANILTFNFTVICINPKSQSDLTPVLANNSNNSFTESVDVNFGEQNDSLRGDLAFLSLPFSSFHYKFSPREQSQAMTIVAIGALLANFPVIILINWYGPRYVFSVVGLLGAAVTCTVPLALRQGFNWFLATRFLQGVAFAGDMATFGHFLTHWTGHRRYGFLTATLALYVQLAPFFTYPISGLLCNSAMGWPSVYYAHSLVAALFFGAFMAFYRNNLADKHQIAIGQSDANVQQNGSAARLTTTISTEFVKMDISVVREARKAIPYKDIVKSPAVWAIFVSAIGDFTAVNLLYQFTPIYLYRVQDLAVMETGVMATIPPLVQAVTKELAGLINDRIPRSVMGETVKTKLFNSISLISVALFLLGLSFIPRGHGYLALGLITAGEALLGFIIGGFYKSGPVISGIYAPFIMGQVSTALTLTMLVVPLLVNWLTPDNTSEEWAMAFWLVALIIVLSNTFYLFFAKGEPEVWSTVEHYLQRHQRPMEEISRRDGQMMGENAKTTNPNGNQGQKFP